MKVFTEDDLIQRVKPHIEDKYRIFEEIGLLSRSIDMVLFDGKSLITIEFKMNDWKKAVIQIKDHLIAADYACLCMPKRKVSGEMLELLTKNGIGLWLYDFRTDELTKETKPCKSKTQWMSYKDLLTRRLHKIINDKEGR